MKIFLAALLQTFVLQLSAQFTFFAPKESFAIEVSLENSNLKRLPVYRNAITSLTVSGDNIIGGTTAAEGLSPFIFNASISARSVTGFIDVSKTVPGQRSIRTGFSKGKNHLLYAGTLANKNEKGENQAGHLIEINADAGGASTIRDLGIPVPGEGVFSLAADSRGSVLYGITYPTGIFFTYDIATKAVKTYRDIVPSARDQQTLGEYLLQPEDWLCKALIEGPDGLIYGSLPVSKLFTYDPIKQLLQVSGDTLPEVWGHRALGQVESWALGKNGKLYGGNSGDGQLFEVNTANKKVTNLGKPAMVPGLKGLAFARDGKLYGIAGALPGYSHLFSYAPGEEGFRDYGNPQFTMKAPGIEQGIDWRGFQLGTITTSEDGKYVVLGEDESLSQLLVFAVDPRKLAKR